ncbi:PaaI family thioesterase [Moorella sulfitireducens]|uniref:PaaI family thioesterase n=1 Tax=Neomoorella sulfitireducens TaxID=2972948 RepID=UPI0021ACA8C4|nr:PaaI family thioesterase [Moorella sulfitireducens]
MNGGVQGVPANPFIELLEIEFIRVEPGQAETRLKIASKHLNPWNYVHGGVFAAMADATMGASIRGLAKVFTTVGINLNYIKPVREGEEITCRGSVVHAGSRIIQTQAVMTVETRLVATASATFYVLDS